MIGKGAMVTISNDGPETVEVRHGGGRAFVRAGEVFRVFTNALQLTPVPKQTEDDHLHFGAAKPVEPCRVGEE